MTVIQLRDELARRGLRRMGTQTEMVSRLKENENLLQKLGPNTRPIEKGEQPDEHPDLNLNSLSRSHLVSEIVRRQNDVQISSRTSKIQLIEMLQNLLLHQTGHDGPITDLRQLLAAIHSDPSRVTPDLILNTLSTNIFSLSQGDLNVLYNTDMDDFIPMFTVLFHDVEKLNCEQLYQAFRAVHFFTEIIPKHFSYSNKQIDVSTLEALVQAIGTFKTEMSTMQLAEVVEIAQQYKTSPNSGSILAELQTRLGETYKPDDIYSRKQLQTILNALPANAYETFPEAIDNIMSRITKGNAIILPENAIQLAFTINKLGLTYFPFGVLEAIHGNYQHGVYKKLAPISILHLTKILCKYDVLSRNIANNFFEVLSGHYYYDTAGLNLYTNFLYLTHQHGFFQFTSHRVWLLNRWLYSENNLELESLAKLTAVYVGHITTDKLNQKLLDEISQLSRSSEQITRLRPIFSEILNRLNEICSEKNIYHYQQNSYEKPATVIKQQLSSALAHILLMDPLPYPEVLDYMLSNLNDIHVDIVLEDFRKWLEFDTFPQVLWRLREKAKPSNIKAYLESQLHGMEDNPTTQVYYCVKLANWLYNLGMIGEGLVKNVEAKAYDHLVSNYQTMDKTMILPMMYNLGLDINRPFGQEVLSYLDSNPFNPSVAKGEMMLENIVMLDRANCSGHMPSASGYMRSATNHLFYRTNDIIPEQGLLSDLITSLSKNINIDLLAVGNFLLNYRHQLHKDDIPDMMALLKPVWNSLPSDLTSFLESQLNITEISDTIRIQAKNKDKISGNLENYVPSMESLDILDNLAENKCYVPEILFKFTEFMTKIKREEDLLLASKKLLNLCSVIGHQTNATRVVSQLFDRYNLWNAADMSTVIDYLFLTTLEKGHNNIAEDRFMSHISAETLEETYVNPTNNMTAFKAFTSTSVLEPRLIVNNQLSTKPIQVDAIIQYSPVQMMNFLKINAICNKFNANKDDDILHALNQFYELRNQMRDLNRFKKFLSYNLGASSGSTADRTGWQGDLNLPQARLTLMLISESDLITNLKSGTKQPNYLFRVQREQLEKFGNRRIQALEVDIWEDMGPEARDRLVQHIKSKFRFDRRRNYQIMDLQFYLNKCDKKEISKDQERQESELWSEYSNDFLDEIPVNANIPNILRRKIAEKYKSSTTNKSYVFPRQLSQNRPQTRAGKRSLTPVINSDSICNRSFDLPLMSLSKKSPVLTSTNLVKRIRKLSPLHNRKNKSAKRSRRSKQSPVRIRHESPYISLDTKRLNMSPIRRTKKR